MQATILGATLRYVDLKRNFIRDLILKGESSPAAASPEIRERVPEAILKRWTEKFYTFSRIDAVPECPRLVNHFQIGADPEFVFKNGNTVLDASSFAMKAGLCIGADNNGRLVELRPAPSRFALKVVASMLAELRWLSILYPKTTELQWKAGAWTGAEGLGGHVHFGRKVHRQKSFEVTALDNLTGLLFLAGIYPYAEHQARLAGPGGYGKYSDTRVQVHGYEYRTPPSWLFTPWHAFLALTLAKLVVAVPELALEMAKPTQANEARRRIRNILVQYKGRDDDALIACMGFNVWGLPNVVCNDFKSNWGITARSTETYKSLPYKLPEMLPSHIEPSAQEINEVFEYLSKGRALTGLLPSAPNWAFQTVPKGYFALLNYANTLRAPGLGELARDLLSPVQIPLTFVATDAPMVYIPRLWKFLVGRLKPLRDKYPALQIKVDYAHNNLQLSKGALTPNMVATTRALLTEFFPVTRFADVEKFPRDAWLKRLEIAQKALERDMRAPATSACLFNGKI
jgi:hypothetical protein